MTSSRIPQEAYDWRFGLILGCGKPEMAGEFEEKLALFELSAATLNAVRSAPLLEYQQ